MNLAQLTVFREVMESGSISQTAKKLGRTQPAISLALKNLEKSLGLSLFERRGRRLIPVPEAQYLLAEAVEILGRVATVSGTLKELKSAAAGSLHIAAMPGPSAFLLPPVVSENLGNDPGFQTTIASRSSAQIRELASTQSIDFGFADFDEPTKREAQYTADVISANCFCALHHEHPLARRKKVTIGDLDGASIGTLNGDHPLLRKLKHAFENEGAQFSSNIAAQFFLPLIPFISAGHCCAIMDPLTVVTEREMNIAKGQIVFLPFAAPVRYEYATLTPSLRPPSQLALRIKDEWLRTLFEMLEDVGAMPAINAAS
ncbi:MAG: LysR family transcriptional regulator [Pseudomonadota bacterium]